MEPEQTKNKIPILIVTDEKWSNDIYVVFKNEEILGSIIPNDWIREKHAYVNKYTDVVDEVSYNEIEQDMVKDFLADNEEVDGFWPEYNICKSDKDNSYYSYDENGFANYIGNFDNINDVLESLETEKNLSANNF